MHVASQSKTSPKDYHSYIRKRKVVTSTIRPIKNANGDYRTEETEMSNSLNTFFASVFTLEDLDKIPYATPIQEENANTLDNIHIIQEQLSLMLLE